MFFTMLKMLLPSFVTLLVAVTLYVSTLIMSGADRGASHASP